jgi:predicted nucleic-acid-binding protein
VLTVDTTVVVRLITNDSPRDTKRAAALFSSNKIYLSSTVLLETEWVLRYAYRLKPDAISKSFRGLLGLASVSVADPPHINRALLLYERGLDFADALHLAGANGSGLKTLDRELVEKARTAGVRGVTLL